MKVVDPQNKKKEEEEEDGEMGILYNPSKIMKLVPFILIIDGTPKQHKLMPWKDFNPSLKGLRWRSSGSCGNRSHLRWKPYLDHKSNLYCISTLWSYIR